MSEVFVSYKKEERAKAERVVIALRKRGYSVWWDENLTPRSQWDAEIEHQIEEARAVLVLWSEKAAATHLNERQERVGTFVRKEAEFALRKGKYVPSRIERCELPLSFSDRQTADLSDWDFSSQSHSGWVKVLEWIAPLVGRIPSVLDGALPSNATAPNEANKIFDLHLLDPGSSPEPVFDIIQNLVSEHVYFSLPNKMRFKSKLVPMPQFLAAALDRAQADVALRRLQQAGAKAELRPHAGAKPTWNWKQPS